MFQRIIPYHIWILLSLTTISSVLSFTQPNYYYNSKRIVYSSSWPKESNSISFKHDPSLSSPSKYCLLFTSSSSSSQPRKTSSLKSASSSTVNNDSRTRNKNTDTTNFKSSMEQLHSTSKEFETKSLQSLDMKPLLNIISQFCVTRRGREALVSLVKDKDSGNRNIFLFRDTNQVSRNSRFWNSNRNYSGKNNVYSGNENALRIATSAQEAREEYKLVQEATDILKLDLLQQQQNIDTNADDEDVLWPWGKTNTLLTKNDNSHNNDDDYDEWLEYTNPNEIKLQHILEAEQLVNKMIQTYNWGICIQKYFPGLSNITTSFMDKGFLDILYNDISDRVKVIQLRSSATTKSYKFQINLKKYPELEKLRQQRVSCKDNVKQQQKLDDEIKSMEDAILYNLSNTLYASYNVIQSTCMNCITRLDIVFAKANFGLYRNGIVPIIQEEGIISIQNFIHPVLAMTTHSKRDSIDIIPVTLELSKEKGKSILVISGPNGGGKSMVLKSFGLVCIMAKLGIPIPIRVQEETSSISYQHPRIDFFDTIFLDIGDGQNVIEGESTFMAKLNTYSQIIHYITLRNELFHQQKEEKEEQRRTLLENDQKQVILEGEDSSSTDNTQFKHEQEEQQKHSLILLDELASGSDAQMASSIGQALLEHLMQYCNDSNDNNGHYSRVVTTTHSSRIKTMAFEDDRFNCASMSIEDDEENNNNNYNFKVKKPSYKIMYGQIGQSHAFDAASRCCNPVPLPRELLNRAYSIYDGEESNDEDENGKNTGGSRIPKMIETLEKQKKSIEQDSLILQEKLSEADKIRKATFLLAKSFETRLSQIEIRLDHILTDLNKDEATPHTLVGNTLSELRIVREHIKSDVEILAEKGLKMVTPTYQFYNGETVVIITQGSAMEGAIAHVVTTTKQHDDGDISQELMEDEVMIYPSFGWEDTMNSNDEDNNNTNPIIVKRNDIAIWDYHDDNLQDPTSSYRINGVLKQQQLFQTLKGIKKSDSTSVPTNTNSKVQKTMTNKANDKKSSSFVSARQRKAVAAAAAADKKKLKKKKGGKR